MLLLEELQVYRISVQFRLKISELNKNIPRYESSVLSRQLLRSSRSVAANIAEGYGRFHYKENIQYCRQARGSLFETMDHISVALENGYITTSDYVEVKELFNYLLKLTNGYIAYLQKRENNKSIKPQ